MKGKAGIAESRQRQSAWLAANSISRWMGMPAALRNMGYIVERRCASCCRMP
jgi:hypothetical protein